MNPEQNQVSVSPERPTGVELPHIAPESLPLQSEIEKQPDQQEKETNKAVGDVGTTGLPLVSVPQSATIASGQQSTGVTATAPSTAKDTERMEKEWAQKIKQTLSSTKGDPYNKEEGIKALRADYMFKRYGRKIGDNN